eukprot:TRINITY_DN10644_c5_g1_i1.p1 TRINITY_DN10644_c5_g1~~TRINITY_DN10644_c5_g1_i1.p1  ORF type:complete len:101 (-),score=8.00 TRINITY_DN10644_c5_g1_i1:91-393(-)
MKMQTCSSSNSQQLLKLLSVLHPTCCPRHDRQYQSLQFHQSVNSGCTRQESPFKEPIRDKDGENVAHQDSKNISRTSFEVTIEVQAILSSSTKEDRCSCN